MTYEELIKAQDEQRTARSFISFLGGVFGNDQTTAGQDAYSYNQPGQYQNVSPYGVSVEGRPVSNLQGGAITLSLPVLLIGGLLAYAVLKG